MTLNSRQRRFALTSVSGVLLTGLILLLANVLLSWVYVRWDITRTHAYSLSPSSKKLVRSLDEPILIKAYFSPDLPSPYNTYTRYVKDILMEYRNASRGKVRFEFVPSLPTRDFEEKAIASGMQPIQFEQMGSDQLQIRRGFMGLALYYRDRVDGLPLVKDPTHLEYDLTSRIARMARRDKKKIATVLGHGESAWRGTAVKLAQDLPAFYDLDHPVNLPLAVDGPIKADAVLVVGPQSLYDEKSLWIIDQTLMSGVPIAFLIDTKRFSPGQFMMSPLKTGLEELLQTYGIKLSDRLVYDAECESVGMTQNIGGMGFTTSIRYPYVPQITRFAKKHPILSGITSVSFAFPSVLESGPLPPGVTHTPLLFTSDKSWLAPSTLYSVAPNSIIRPQPTDPHGPYTVAGLWEGTFPSHFAGKPAPVPGAAPLAQSPKNSIFVLTTSHVLDESLPSFPGTDALITNALAYLSHDETLIGIQSKGDVNRPLKNTPEAVRNLIKILCVFVIPFLPVAWGLVRWRRREAWRTAISAKFNSPATPS